MFITVYVKIILSFINIIFFYLEPCDTTKIIQTCAKEFSIFNDIKDDFGYSWLPTENNFSSLIELYNITDPYKLKSSFKYTSSLKLNSFGFFGKLFNYYGGGYLYKFEQMNSLDSIRQDLQTLKKLNWIDRQTRAVEIEFNLYNPNLNTFSYNSILFEILPTGNLVKLAKFNPLLIYSQDGGSSDQLALAFNIILILFVVFFMVKEIRSMIKLGREYFFKFWSYLEWMIIACAWASLGTYMNRVYAKSELLESLKHSNSGDKFINFQLASGFNETLGVLLGLCSFIGILKFLKVLSYSRNIRILEITLRKAFNDLVMFLLMFLIIYLAFVQIFYAFLGDKNVKYSTFVSTMETLFLVLLGSFKKEDFFLSGSVDFVSLIFVFYNLMMLIIILNIFITIITDHYESVRVNKEVVDVDIVILDCVINKVKGLIKTVNSFFEKNDKEADQNENKQEFRDKLESFSKSSNDLMDKLQTLIKKSNKI
jgi:polycystin 1L2